MKQRNQMKKCYILMIVLALLCVSGSAEANAQVVLVVGHEYDLTFDDGESIRHAKVLSITESSYEIQIRGLTERIKVERSTVVSADRVQDQPTPEPARRPFFSRFEAQVLIDFHLGLAAFQKFDTFFPAAGFGLNAYLSQPLPYIRANAFHGEIMATQITDGDRTINVLQSVVTARYLFQRIGFTWYSGVGGGIAGLSLTSYSFSRTSYAMLGRVEFGSARQVTEKLALSVGLNATYWQDNLELLISVSAQIAAAYQF